LFLLQAGKGIVGALNRMKFGSAPTSFSHVEITVADQRFHLLRGYHVSFAQWFRHDILNTLHGTTEPAPFNRSGDDHEPAELLQRGSQRHPQDH
jgi:hypothetical protein